MDRSQTFTLTRYQASKIIEGMCPLCGHDLIAIPIGKLCMGCETRYVARKGDPDARA